MSEDAVLPSRVVLVGIMGAGKTTVGRLLALRLGYKFRDLDEEIERRVGLSVKDIFERYGEARFREDELREAEDAMARERLVVATGGGAFAQPLTRTVLREAATTVWLRCTVDAVLLRVPLDGSRPLAESRETIAQLIAEREHAYSLADVTVDTTAVPPDSVVQSVADALDAATRARARRLGGA
jgi:shikimate kinase